jgi:hypothetical protein
MRRVFFLLLKSLKENVDVYHLVKQYGHLSLLEEFKVKKYERLT